jgi:hypothetical protein
MFQLFGLMYGFPGGSPIAFMINDYQRVHNLSLVKKCWSSWALVAHACNPSYSGGRDQED